MANTEMIVEPSLDREDVLKQIAEKCPGGVQVGEWLLYKEHDLRVTVDFGTMQSNKEQTVWSVQLLLIADHPFFDEELVESLVGVGGNPDHAIRNAVDNICTAILPCIITAFGCQNNEIMEADVMGEKHRFRIPCSRANQHAGGSQPTDLWEIVKGTLPQYLGTKRCYWIKLFSACIDGVPNCEARINGEVYPDLTNLLYQDAVKHRNEKGYLSDKVFVVLVQEEETCKPCPFTKQEVGEMTFKALRLYQNIIDEKSAQETQRLIASLAPTKNLGLELLAFIPEEFARQVVQYRDNDSLMPVIDRGKPEFVLKKSQVRSYGYIADAVTQFLHKQNPKKEEIKQVLAVSGKFHALSEALDNGAKLEDLKFSPLVYFVGQDYKVW